MKNLFLFLRSRHVWAVMTVIVASLAIWLVGPLFSFGGLKPLAAVGIRLALIVLLIVGWIGWLVGWSSTIVLMMFVCLVIWFAFPLLTLAGNALLAPVTVRVGAIAGVLLAYSIYVTLHGWHRVRGNRGLRGRVLRLGQPAGRSVTASRLTEIDGMARMALRHLKGRRAGTRGLIRLFGGQAHLYDVPWYVVLGSKGSGKTTAMLNAGLVFPLDVRTQHALAPEDGRALPGWRLTNEAVWIDTAGHYAQHGTSNYALPVRTSGTFGGDKAHPRPVHIDAARKASDAAEWHGFLQLLLKMRPRMPINGALLTVNLAALTHVDPNVRVTESRVLRARLEDMRGKLGIAFPVWLIVTKMDRLTGFTDYFNALSEQARTQIWGFTLPRDGETLAPGTVPPRCKSELDLLATRLADGVTQRLRDETDVACRKRIATLPEAFSALTEPLTQLIAHVFDSTAHGDTSPQVILRGVYLTSAEQTGKPVAADRQTVLQRMVGAAGIQPKAVRRTNGDTSYFLSDLLSRLALHESHLARPDPQREHRALLQRLLGHSLVWLLAAGLATHLWSGLRNERASLAAVGNKARALSTKLTGSDLSTAPDQISPVLDDAIVLSRDALHLGTDSRDAYDVLLARYVLPRIVGRMEEEIASAAASGDAESLYDVLRVYLMLYDKAKFNAEDVKAWVLDDWSKRDSAAVFGGRAAMIRHAQALFASERVVQSPAMRNDALILQARVFLDGRNATDRLYQRAKAAMQKDAPEEFTLLHAVGPQAGTVFTRASGAPLNRGVPGLFTFKGYRAVFDKRLPEFLRIASEDDAWVMGRRAFGDAAARAAGPLSAASRKEDALSTEIRRQYLMEYAQLWDRFLNDVRPVSGMSLEFHLQVLRSFAGPDSPLIRFARAAVDETTLTQPVPDSGGSLLETLGQHAKAAKMIGTRSSEQVERELVDDHFAALREVVGGHSNIPTGSKVAAVHASTAELDGITNLLTSYYATLAVSGHALSSNSMPPTSDTAARLKITAGTMPAPFRAVLLQLATDGSREVNQRIGQLLSQQMQAVVGDTCRLTVEGNYPFAPDSQREISLDDFTRVFAQGGVIDDFFVKTLAPFVDTSAKPWRYRTLPGATEPVQGPELEPFEHAMAIRDIFFNGRERRQFAWNVDIRVPELDSTIMTLSLDVDGQRSVYQHGPVVPFAATWPGTRGGVHAEITASPHIGPTTSTVVADGPWALMRLLQKGRVTQTATLGRTRVAFDFHGRRAVLDITTAGSVGNPLTSDVLKGFRCPSSAPVYDPRDSGPPVGLPRDPLPAMAPSGPSHTRKS